MTEEDELDHLAAAFARFDPQEALPGYRYPPVSLLASADFTAFVAQYSANSLYLPLYLGSAAHIVLHDMLLSPNVLVAGTLGTGKTQFLYNQLAIWLCSKHPAEFKVILCGSKPVDYGIFQGLSQHFLAAAPGAAKVVIAENGFKPQLTALLQECLYRLNLFMQARVKSVSDYNEQCKRLELKPQDGYRFLPDIVLVIDDLSNFVFDDEALSLLTQLTSRNSRTGIFVLAVTSQIASNKITALLKANFSFRAAFRLMAQADSRKIIDRAGAEKLSSPGHMLFELNGRLTETLQFAVEFDGLKEMVDYIKLQPGFPGGYQLGAPPEPAAEKAEFDPQGLDPFFADAARLIVMHQQGSTSLIQRKMKLGYNRAGRIIDQLEAAGIVGPFEGSKAREVLFHDEYSLERYLESLEEIDEETPAITEIPPLVEESFVRPLAETEPEPNQKKKPGLFSRFFGDKR